MIRLHSYSFVVALSLGVAVALPAQSTKKRDRERDIERTADDISRTVERAVDGAMRTVDKTLDRTMRALTSSRFSDQDWQQGGDRIDSTFSFSRDGTIDLTSVSGDIIVTGWNRAEVKVHARTERGHLRWSASSSRVTIETESIRGRMGDTRYELSVPEGVRVIMKSMSGDVSAKGTRGPVDANTTSGDIEVADAAGRVELQTISGDITASRLSGEVEGSTVSGSIDAEEVEARSVHVESTSGDLTLGNVRSKDVSASTVSGEVEYTGPIETGGQYEFHSHSGTITLHVPSSVSARFSVETFSGELDSAFPVTIQPSRDRQRGRRIDFTVGGGDARVIAETFSGNVEIRRDARR
jgi:DUF4097 and DUF4098 domain-containing protein YvlB